MTKRRSVNFDKMTNGKNQAFKHSFWSFHCSIGNNLNERCYGNSDESAGSRIRFHRARVAIGVGMFIFGFVLASVYFTVKNTGINCNGHNLASKGTNRTTQSNFITHTPARGDLTTISESTTITQWARSCANWLIRVLYNIPSLSTILQDIYCSIKWY